MDARRRAMRSLLREVHVALLVTEGKTNREAATMLFLSEKTIEHHLHNAFAKVGVRSRTELARHMISIPNASNRAQLRPD
jgi:DNA-binding NarL/FixJ family response regulator